MAFHKWIQLYKIEVGGGGGSFNQLIMVISFSDYHTT